MGGDGLSFSLNRRDKGQRRLSARAALGALKQAERRSRVQSTIDEGGQVIIARVSVFFFGVQRDRELRGQPPGRAGVIRVVQLGVFHQRPDGVDGISGLDH
jgi:hypothetical protein